MTDIRTHAIHAGWTPDAQVGAINVPIYTSTTFAQDGLAQLRGGYEYARCGNPTTTALESTLAALESAQYARVFASGMAATDTLLRVLLTPGSHVVLGNDAYGGTFRLLDSVFAPWGVELSVVDTTDLREVEAALRPTTTLVWVETPSNPALRIADIAGLSTLAHQVGAKVVVDNTFATPYLQQPLHLGADVVVHSTTKYLGGHSDVVGGAVITNDAALDEQVFALQFGIGAIASPFDCYLAYRGIKTLAVRMDAHCSNAQTIAEYLAEDPRVSTVHYPGLSTHPGHDLARRQMSGFGGMIAVEFAGGRTAAEAFCLSTKLIRLAESLGGVESLLEHPATMTHSATRDTGHAVPQSLVRLSIGIEGIDDLVADIRRALDAIPAS